MVAIDAPVPVATASTTVKFAAPDTDLLPIVSRDDGAGSNGNGGGGITALRNGNSDSLEVIIGDDDSHANGADLGNSDENLSAAHSNGVVRVRVAPQPPAAVKVRVGNGYGYTNGNGHHNGNGDGNGNGNGHKARVESLGRDTVLMAAPRPITTSQLRESDLNGMRYRLKTAQPTLPLSLAKKRTRRPLPYFLMRHRNMRARTRIGHVRTQASIRRFGKGGAMTIVVKLGLVFFMLWGVVTTATVGAGYRGRSWFFGQLPPIDPKHLADAIALNGINVQTTKIYDRNGVPLYDLVDEDTGRREELPLDKISPLVISATLAAEDPDFYTNPGIDIRGIGRAIVINLSKQGQSGASTITQQLVRQVLLTPDERSKGLSSGLEGFARKIKEAVLAVELTQKYGKDLILKCSLIRTPMGTVLMA